MSFHNAEVVDLFCGIGGLSYGFKEKRFNVVAGVDIDESCQYAYEANNGAKFHCKDLTEKDSTNFVRGLFSEESTKILVGCTPCQPFSSCNRRRSGDERWRLVDLFARIVVGVRPDVISMENIPALISYKHGGLLLGFVSRLENAGYKVWYGIADCRDYGVPQSRRRLVLLASLHRGVELVPPTCKSPPTVWDTIGKLPPIKAGESYSTDILHTACSLSPLNLRRIRQSKQWGNWKDWDKEIRSSRPHHLDVYGRMAWDRPAPTLTTRCTSYSNGRYGHPDQDRTISLREAALLQSFPEEYELMKAEWGVSRTAVARHIGNSVPPLLAQAIAKSCLP